MNAWLLATFALILGLVPCGYIAVRGSAMDRLIAVELAGLVTALAIVLLAEGTHRPSLYDLALTVALLSFASTMVFARFLERWL